MDFSESFEKVVRACQASNDYMPVWEKFINTEFFITVLPQDTGSQTSDFRFVIYNSPKNDEPTVIVSETLDYIKSSATNKAIKVRGATLIFALNHQVGILVALSDGGFGIPANLVAWLRAGIQPVS